MTHYTTTVRLVAEGSGRPLAGLRVSLFDHDRFSSDDLLGTGTTDAAGEVEFAYDTRDFADLEDRISGSLPDLYCVVYAADGSQIFSNEPLALDNTPRRLIAVELPADVVERHALLA
ncbi:MAG TPA: hypothetical protein VF613_05285 [Longimicrobium sp.]|jgi:hypothetical protein